MSLNHFDSMIIKIETSFNYVSLIFLMDPSSNNHFYYKKCYLFKQLKNRIPSRIIEKAIWGMLPKNVLGREYYRRLFVYSDNKINYAKTKEGEKQSVSLEMSSSQNWIKVDL